MSLVVDTIGDSVRSPKRGAPSRRIYRLARPGRNVYFYCIARSPWIKLGLDKVFRDVGSNE
jgi:hypothetical protein